MKTATAKRLNPMREIANKNEMPYRINNGDFFLIITPLFNPPYEKKFNHKFDLESFFKK